MQVIVSPSSRTVDTIPIYLYYILQPSYRPPTQLQGCSPPRTLVGASTSSTNIDPDQISWTDTGPDQTSPTDVGLGPNIINRCWYWVDYFFLPLQLLLSRHDWFHPIRAPTKYLQQTSRLQQSPSGWKHLACQTPGLWPTFPNIHRSPTNCHQPTPQLDELSSTNARVFEPRAVTPSKPSEILTVGGPPKRSS